MFLENTQNPLQNSIGNVFTLISIVLKILQDKKSIWYFNFDLFKMQVKGNGTKYFLC